jgi:hypothetical protein
MKATPEALDLIVKKTHGYPYFVQEWGKHSWDAAKTSPITQIDVENASTAAIAAPDESFFRVRFDRLTPAPLLRKGISVQWRDLQGFFLSWERVPV